MRAASRPQRMAGCRAACVPDRPGWSIDLARLSPSAPGTVEGVEVPEPAASGGGEAGAAGPFRVATTIRRWLALNRGLQVVKVSRLSVDALSTETSLGLTTF